MVLVRGGKSQNGRGGCGIGGSGNGGGSGGVGGDVIVDDSMDSGSCTCMDKYGNDGKIRRRGKT